MGRRTTILVRIGALAGIIALAAPQSVRADCDGRREEVALTGVTPTFEVVLEDGRQVRLAGLDFPSPERADAATIAAASAALRALADDGVAEFAPLAAKPDRWGRWPGALYRADAPQKSYALTLLEEGAVRVRPDFETRACARERLAAEGRAIAAGLGVWADPDYGVLDGHDPAAFTAMDGRFVVAEGVVRRVGQGRSRLYLDFGPRDALSAVVTRKEEAAFVRAGVNLRDLKGARLRVRGVLDLRYAPRLELVEPAALQILAPMGPSP